MSKNARVGRQRPPFYIVDSSTQCRAIPSTFGVLISTPVQPEIRESHITNPYENDVGT